MRTLVIALAALTGYVVSDFLSEFVHWAGETVGDETTPIFGPNCVRPFRFYHVEPEDITKHDFGETSCNSCSGAAPRKVNRNLFQRNPGLDVMMVRTKSRLVSVAQGALRSPGPRNQPIFRRRFLRYWQPRTRKILILVGPLPGAG